MIKVNIKIVIKNTSTYGNNPLAFMNTPRKQVLMAFVEIRKSIFISWVKSPKS